ncbi:MAG: MFS transporter [Marmoricola sp.]
MAGLATDIRPLRVSAPSRRLWLGNSVAQLGQQMTAVTIAIQVYAITSRSFAVGLVGACALLPLVGFGLYGGAVADAMDRRKLALGASALAWACSMGLAAHGFWHSSHVGVLYALVALQSAAYALNSPARNAMIARLLPAELLPARAAPGSLHRGGLRGAARRRLPDGLGWRRAGGADDPGRRRAGLCARRTPRRPAATRVPEVRRPPSRSVMSFWCSRGVT